jgi:hypothetical protein
MKKENKERHMRVLLIYYLDHLIDVNSIESLYPVWLSLFQSINEDNPLVQLEEQYQCFIH